MARTLKGKAEPAYSIGLFVTKRVESHQIAEGSYDTREILGETVELARVELSSTNLASLLTTAGAHLDIIKETA